MKRFAVLVVWFALVSPASADSGSLYTTVNPAVDGPGTCQNGNAPVNCNIYLNKKFVWLSGKASATIADGTYFFVVLEPGGQNNPNDGSAGNLSSSFDAYTNRTFTVSNGVITYSGTHDFANNMIRLMPYQTTSNPGGEYDLAICSLANGYPVTQQDCKHDNFKVALVTYAPRACSGFAYQNHCYASHSRRHR